MSRSENIKILCLDAGDSRCMSQLYLLEEYMHRLEYKLGKKILPCEHFDLITGIDSSSPIAACLGLFRMSVEEAQEAYAEIYTAVFTNESSPETKSLRLGEELGRIMENRGIPPSTRMRDLSATSGCKVALCYSPSSRLDHCGFFRNYQSPQQTTHDVTIIDAIRASWATPGLIQSVQIGPDGRQEEVVSAINRFGNPTQEVIKESYHLFGPQASLACLLNLGSGYRGGISLEENKEIASNVAGKLVMDMESISEELYRRFARLGVYHRFSVDHGLEGWGRFEAAFGVMKGHVDAYLSKTEPSTKLDRCISTAVATRTVLMNQLYGSNAPGLRSANGLPHLSPYFVKRKGPMQAIIQELVEPDRARQRIMVISGLGGSGKTQLALKFARDFQDNYRHILFIDASSSDSIRTGLVARVRHMKPDNIPTTVSEAITVLENPDERITHEWFIIFDNVDNLGESLSQYIPSCDHGTILITTRDSLVGESTPGLHLKLDSMDEDEAVDVLLSAAFPVGKASPHNSQLQSNERGSNPTTKDRNAAVAIARELGCLPIAIVQAGCYINQHKVLHQYLEQLKTNRSELLKRATRTLFDRLPYPHSVYASFDIVLQALSPRSVHLLGILSFFHFSNIPRPLFGIAAKSGFAYERFELADRPAEFNDAIQFLVEVLCPQGVWRDDQLNQLLEELQKYSLVSLVSTGTMISLRFHPLVHGWSRDRMSRDDHDKHLSAAVRLFVAGITDGDDFGLYEHLSSHTSSFLASSDTLHVNDRAAISMILYKAQHSSQNLEIWKAIYQGVEAIYGKRHVRTGRAALGLADAYWDHNREKAIAMTNEVIAVNEEDLGINDLETIAARSTLARQLRSSGAYMAAEKIEAEVLRVRIRTLGFANRTTALGMEELSKTCSWQGRQQDCKGLLLGAVAINTKVIGRSAQRTISSLEALAHCHVNLGERLESEKVHKEVLELRQSLLGQEHLETVASMVYLAACYQMQGRYKEAKLLRESEVKARRSLQGNLHKATLVALSALAQATFRLGEFAEAEGIFDELLESNRTANGSLHWDTLRTMYWAGRTRFAQYKYEEAEGIWRKWLAGCQEAYPDRHTTTLDAMYWVARVTIYQGRYEDAIGAWSELLAANRQTYGDLNAITFNAIAYLAWAHFELGNFQDAERLRKEEFEGRRKIQGYSHPGTLNASHWLARAYQAQNRNGDAVKTWSNELTIRRQSEGSPDFVTLECIGWLALAHFQLKNYEEAESLRREELTRRVELQSKRHPSTLHAMSWLAEICLIRGQNEEAIRLTEEELAFCREIFGKGHLMTLGAMSNLSRVYSESGDHNNAAVLLKEELEECLTVQGTSDPRSTLNVMDRLARNHLIQKQYSEAEQLLKEELHLRRELKDPLDYTLFKLSRVYQDMGRYSEAKDSAEEALRLRHEYCKPDDPSISEITQRLESINMNIESIAKGPPNPDDIRPIVTVESTAADSSVPEGSSAPDPGGDPKFLPFSAIESPISVGRPRSPFNIRPMFGARPNSWSMF